jgi:hypothetical protein
MISLASELGVIPAEHKADVIQTLVDDIAAHDWHLNCGIVGIKYLLKTLSENGRGDVALMIMQQRTPPSYIYMVEQGATTMWETWTGTEYEPTASRNHIMVRPATSNRNRHSTANEARRGAGHSLSCASARAWDSLAPR